MTKRFHLLGFLVALGVVVGCGSATQTPAPPNTTASPSAKPGDDEDDHDHGEGPHGGTIFDWGKYHVEFTVNHKTQEATVYVLTTNLKKAVPIAAEKMKLSIKSPAFEADLKPVPQDGETDGKSSRFVAKHEKFGVEQEFAGTLTGTASGRPLSADFAEQAHDEKKK